MTDLQKKLNEWQQQMQQSHLDGEKILTHKLGNRLAILSQFSSRKKLESSKIYQGIKKEVESVTFGYEYGCYANPAQAEKKPFYRAVSWDLDYGMNYDGIVETLKTHALLSKADIYFFPSTDLGMLRSGNRNIARSLAMELDYNYIFASNYLHVSGSHQDDQPTNQIGLEGNVILSRYPLSHPRIVNLDTHQDALKRKEKCVGIQKALLVDVTLADQKVTLACVHLDPLSSPRQRAAGMQKIFQKISTEVNPLPVLVGGCFNTSTYNAKSLVSLLSGFFNKVFRGVDYILEEHHSFPERHFDKPIFEVIKKHKFHFETLNEIGKGTLHYTVDDLKTNSTLHELIPNWFLKAIVKILRRHGGKISLKMDWFVGNNQIKASGYPQSEKPKVVTHLYTDQGPISSHDAIVLDFEIVK